MTIRDLVVRIASRLGGRDPGLKAVWLSLILLGLSACLAGCQGNSRRTGPTGPATALAATVSGRDSSRRTIPLVIPRGTPVAISLLETVGSRGAEEEDECFDGRLAEGIVVDGRTMIPSGGRVRVRSSSTKIPGGEGRPGSLLLRLDSIEVAEGEWIYVKTTSVLVRQGSQTEHVVVPPATAQEDVLLPSQIRLVFLMREDQAVDR